jgi:hypothetical protein
MSPEMRRLVQVYETKLVALASALPAGGGLHGPHLVDIDADGYRDARVKVMVVGQQAYDWGAPWGPNASASEIENRLADYRGFRLGRNPGGQSWMRSPFWQAAHRVYSGLNPGGPPDGFLWSNLLKIDQGKWRPEPDVVDALQANFNVLPAEIEIARPDAVVFFTGPLYDNDLRRAFDGARHETVDDHATGNLAHVVHGILPAATYRIHHPNHLRLSRKWRLLDDLVAILRRSFAIAG